MNVSYLGPLQCAIARARSILFTPFRLETWLVLGFAAFLSDWFSGGWGQSGWERKARLGYFPGGHFPTPSVPGFHLHDLLPALVWGPLLAGVIVLARAASSSSSRAWPTGAPRSSSPGIARRRSGTRSSCGSLVSPSCQAC